MISDSIGITSIPCTLMRGGTSRGVFFNGAHMPTNVEERDRLLIAALGSPHPLQVDGVGGGNPLTSKVAIVNKSNDPRADVDYLFAQITPERETVDTNATCGNILSAVGPFAVEEGMVVTGTPQTEVRIRNINSGIITLATLETPFGRLRYDGDEPMAGGIRPSAPIRLSLLDAEGSLTGHLLPTGNVREEIQGITVSLLDYAIPVMMIDAKEFGLVGEESAEQIDADRAMLEIIEKMRLEAGRRMGLGDVSRSVVPKVALVSPPRNGGSIASRYLTPWQCHLTHAVTGGLCLTAALHIEGTVANAIAPPVGGASKVITIEHPTGQLQIECTGTGEKLRTSVTRTARLLFRGHVYVPAPTVQIQAAAERAIA